MSGLRTRLDGKRIAFFHQSADLYGSDKILLHLVEAVQQEGCEPIVLLPNTGPLTEECAASRIEYHVLPVLKVSRAMLGPRGLLELSCQSRVLHTVYDRVFAGRRLDLIHSNTLAVLGGAIFARRRRIPHLWHVHEIIEHPWIAKHAFPLFLRVFADHIVCNSNATHKWLVETQPTLAKRSSVIWNGVRAPDRVDESIVTELRHKFRPDGVRLAVGLIGRINRLKGHGLLLDAAEILRSNGIDDFSVIFIGSAPTGQEHFAEQLTQRVAQSPICNRIVTQGFTTNIWEACAALDIVCVPSTEAEAFGLVAAEAMALAKPVVVARLGGLPEIVLDGSTGLTFTPSDAVALATCLEALLRDETRRTRIGRAGKARIEAEFSLERMTDRFVATYLHVIRQSH